MPKVKVKFVALQKPLGIPPNYIDFESRKPLYLPIPKEQFPIGWYRDEVWNRDSGFNIEDLNLRAPNSEDNPDPATGGRGYRWHLIKWQVEGGVEGRVTRKRENGLADYTPAPRATVGASDVTALAFYYYGGGPATGDTPAIQLQAVNESFPGEHAKHIIHNVSDLVDWVINPLNGIDPMTLVRSDTGSTVVISTYGHDLNPSHVPGSFSVTLTANSRLQRKEPGPDEAGFEKGLRFIDWDFLDDAASQGITVSGNRVTVPQDAAPFVVALYESVDKILEPENTIPPDRGRFFDVADVLADLERIAPTLKEGQVLEVSKVDAGGFIIRILSPGGK